MKLKKIKKQLIVQKQPIELKRLLCEIVKFVVNFLQILYKIISEKYMKNMNSFNAFEKFINFLL